MANELKIEYLPIDELKPHEKNAKLHPAEQIEQIKKSIQDYGFRDPVGVWRGEIVEGHGRIIAAKELGLEEIPVIRLDDMTDEQRREYALVHNQTTMNSGFDFAILDGELEGLPDFDAEFYGFSILDNISDDDKYVTKTNIPQYEPSGADWGMNELYDDEKAQGLIKTIEASHLDDVTKDFLIKASYRHIRFNYKRIADFYANADPETQSLMESSALVIIDYDDAIKNGYTNLDAVAGSYAYDEA